MNKYRAVPTVIDGIRFASKAEARRYGELKLLERGGKIKHIEMQMRFPLDVSYKFGGEKTIGHYVADFYYLQNGKEVIEDVKGFRTPLYKWKKKHFEAQYGIKITEIK